MPLDLVCNFGAAVVLVYEQLHLPEKKMQLTLFAFGAFAASGASGPSIIRPVAAGPGRTAMRPGGSPTSWAREARCRTAKEASSEGLAIMAEPLSIAVEHRQAKWGTAWLQGRRQPTTRSPSRSDRHVKVLDTGMEMIAPVRALFTCC